MREMILDVGTQGPEELRTHTSIRAMALLIDPKGKSIDSKARALSL